jgi:hypothetical protein
MRDILKQPELNINFLGCYLFTIRQGKCAQIFYRLVTFQAGNLASVALALMR